MLVGLRHGLGGHWSAARSIGVKPIILTFRHANKVPIPLSSSAASLNFQHLLHPPNFARGVEMTIQWAFDTKLGILETCSCKKGPAHALNPHVRCSQPDLRISKKIQCRVCRSYLAACFSMISLSPAQQSFPSHVLSPVSRVYHHCQDCFRLVSKYALRTEDIRFDQHGYTRHH